MTVKNLQEKVNQWIDQYGIRYFDERTNALLLMEEVGEFSRLIARKYGEQSFKSPEQGNKVDDNIKEEMADIIFVLTCLANQMQIDLTLAIKENFIKKTNRDKSRHKSNPKLNN